MRFIPAGETPMKAVGADKEGNPAKNTFVQVLMPEGDNFVMRVFTVKPGGHTPRHRHPFEHEVYVLSGKGRIEGDREFEVASGDAAFVPDNDLHCFVNTGAEDLKFICVVKKSAA